MFNVLKKVVAWVIGGVFFVLTTVVGLIAGFLSEVIVSQLPDSGQEPSQRSAPGEMVNQNTDSRNRPVHPARESRAN